METLSLFLWKSIVVSGLLTTWYMVALRGKRLHQYNRVFLLTTLFASLTIPFLNFQLFSVPRIVANGMAPVALLVGATGDAANSTAATPVPAETPVNWLLIAGIAAVTVSITLLFILFTRVIKVRMMCSKYPVTQKNGVNLLLTDSPSAPFTFLKYLFWNKSIPLDGEVGQLIFKHELAHIEQGHTYDKLVSQVLTCIFWFNPFYWLIQKELNIVHEFIADEKAVDNRDTEAFAMMLLQSFNNGSYLVPEHHFFSSTIKRRLTMLQNAAMPRYAKLRQFMAVPLIAMAILVFSFTAHTGLAGNITAAKKKIVLVLDAAHGGKDRGAATDNLAEKDICLQVTKRLQELAPAYNIEVHLTRDNDNYVTLADRVAMTEKIHPDVQLSLHVNNSPGTDKAKGDFDIYVSSQNANAQKSSAYSNAIFQAMVQDGIIPGLEAKGCSHDQARMCSNCAKQAMVMPTTKELLYMLKQVKTPALMMELGDIHNEAAMKKLTDANRQDVLCNAILKGIVEGAAAKPAAPATTKPGGCSDANTPPVPGVPDFKSNSIK